MEEQRMVVLLIRGMRKNSLNSIFQILHKVCLCLQNKYSGFQREPVSVKASLYCLLPKYSCGHQDCLCSMLHQCKEGYWNLTFCEGERLRSVTYCQTVFFTFGSRVQEFFLGLIFFQSLLLLRIWTLPTIVPFRKEWQINALHSHAQQKVCIVVATFSDRSTFSC